MIQIKRIKDFEENQLKELFDSVGWKSAKYPSVLKSAFSQSSNVVSLWQDDRLVGIIRAMGDDCWSTNIDCLIIHKDFQGKGLSKILLESLMNDLKNVQYINVCPDDEKMKDFYSKFGFVLNGCYLQRRNV